LDRPPRLADYPAVEHDLPADGEGAGDKNPEPLVSVILPTHNRPVWLAEALSSVLAGTFDDLEVVVSNNGNREDTRRLQTMIPDPRVRWVEQDRALGPVDNFLAGLAVARGRYVAPLHDDDRWSPGFLATLVPPLERHPEAVLAFADHYLINERGGIELAATEANTERWGRAKLPEGLHRPFFGVVARQSVAMTGCVFRRDAVPIEQIPPDVGPFYDIWTSYLLAKSGGAAYYSSERLLYYRAHGASETGTARLAAHLSAIRGRRRMLRDPGFRPYASVLTTRLARDHVLVGAELLRRRGRSEARSHFAAAIRLDPTLKALGAWAASWIAPSSLLPHL
jgi:glycosyltransferase involved in cell wall biosynthesis